jgi:hypothetical protein
MVSRRWAVLVADLKRKGETLPLLGGMIAATTEKSPNRFAREHILATAVCLYGN